MEDVPALQVSEKKIARSRHVARLLKAGPEQSEGEEIASVKTGGEE